MPSLNGQIACVFRDIWRTIHAAKVAAPVPGHGVKPLFVQTEPGCKVTIGHRFSRQHFAQGNDPHKRPPYIWTRHRRMIAPGYQQPDFSGSVIARLTNDLQSST
jgi:hypothetical protein